MFLRKNNVLFARGCFEMPAVSNHICEFLVGLRLRVLARQPGESNHWRSRYPPASLLAALSARRFPVGDAANVGFSEILVCEVHAEGLG